MKAIGQPIRPVEYARDAMGDVQGVWQVGQRGFNLSDLYRTMR